MAYENSRFEMRTGASDIEAAIAAGREIGAGIKVHQVKDAAPFVIVPAGWNVEQLDNIFLDHPWRVEARPTFDDPESFAAYVNRFKTDATLLFGDHEKAQIVAVLDYHSADGPDPAWCSHRAALAMEISPEWAAWSAKDRKPMSQVEFAEFLEDHMTEIAAPDASVIGDAVTKIQLVRTSTTKAVRNLASGAVQLSYVDDDDNEGTTVVPKMLTLSLRYFKSSTPVVVSARLRYRLGEGGKIAFTYLLSDLPSIEETEFRAVCAEVAKATGVQVLAGTP